MSTKPFPPQNWYTYVQNDPVNFVDLWGLRDIIAGNLVQDVDGKIRDTQTGNVKDVTEIVIDRPEGHTQGHFLSTLKILTKSSDGQTISLYSNSVQSWADKAVPATETSFTLPAGKYEGRLYGETASYSEPIGLVNVDLGVTSDINALIHPNEKTNLDTSDPNYRIWFNTGCSEACQITQGQGREYTSLTKVLKNTGYQFGVGYKNYKDTIQVIINDPPDKKTTRDGNEVTKNQIKDKNK